MVSIMLKNNSYYKNFDFLNENYSTKMHNYFNPYEYNFESSIKDQQNSDFVSMKTKSHQDRKNKKI